jgi:hypothetical protein
MPFFLSGYLFRDFDIVVSQSFNVKMYNSWLLVFAIFAAVGSCWKHTAGSELEAAIGSEDHVLVACKFSSFI